MARDDSPPFGRGQTFYDGASIDSNNLGGAQHEGKIWVFEDLDYTNSGAKPQRSNRPVKCMCVRNVGAAAMLPKRLATLKRSGLNFLGQVDGYGDITAEANAFPIDEWLPAAGVPVNDLFWIVIEGPAMCLTPIGTGEFNGNIANGQNLVALTAATSGATTAGRVACENITGSSAATDYTFLSDQILNRIGQAISARTTGETNSAILINVMNHL